MLVHRSSRHRRPRWINSSVCLVIALCCVAIVPLQFQNLQSAASQLRQLPYSIECEDWVSSAKASAGNIVRQEMGGFGPGWSGNAQLFWTPPPPVDKPIRNWPNLRHGFKPPAAATYEIILHYTTAPDFGMFRVFLDGQASGDIDGYSAKVAPKSQSLGEHKLDAGNHEFLITVFSKSSSSKNFSVGLDRLVLRRINPSRAGAEPPIAAATPPQNPGGGRFPDLRAICIAKPEACCPSGQTTSEGCRVITEALLDIRIRSYVPPRFRVMGRNFPDTDWEMDNIVADRNVDGPYKVWPGCRFNVTSANYAIDNSKNVLQKAGELAEAWLKQWRGGVESAKTFVSQNVAREFCKGIKKDNQTCREKVEPIVTLAINLGLASLGIPPEIPDIQQIRQQGIRYLAAEAASSAIGDPEFLKDLPVDEKDREAFYQQLYDGALDTLSKELNKAIPSPNYSSDNPVTWGHLEPAYAPHNAHLYIEVRIKPGAYAKYLHFISVEPTHKWQPLYLHDLNRVWASIGPIEIPAFIPPDGVILPIELKPFDDPENQDELVKTQIPRIKIWRRWLEQKFGLTVDGLVGGQLNYEGARGEAGYRGSDWDLFYDPYKYLSQPGNPAEVRKSKFRLLTPIGTSNKGILDWESNREVIVANVWDAETKFGVVTKTPDGSGTLNNYVGRIDPAPRCDGLPNLVYGQTWKELPGCARDIGVDAAGVAWIVGCKSGAGDRNNTIHRWNASMQKWDQVDGGAVRIAVEPGGRPWVVNADGNIYRRAGTDWKKSAGTDWEPVSGCARDIAIDQSGEAWIVACTGGVGSGNYSLRRGKGDGPWIPISGSGLRISAAPGGIPWLVNGDGNIYRRLNDQWGNPLPGCARDIAAYGWNHAWVIGCSKTGSNYSIHRWSEDDKKWILVDGVGWAIAVEPNGRPWVVTNGGTIMVRVQKDY